MSDIRTPPFDYCDSLAMTVRRTSFSTPATRRVKNKSEKGLMENLLNNREPLLTTTAVSKWLGISTRTLCLWAECGEIPAIKLGRQWRFRQSELADWLQEQDASKVRNLTLVAAGAGGSGRA